MRFPCVAESISRCRRPKTHAYFMCDFPGVGCYRLNHPAMTDNELLRRYVDDRSESAFSELVGRHMRTVYFTALRQLGGDAHLAKDVAQKVFCDLAKKAPSLCRHPSLTG
jgi:hypothetical protein